MVIKRGIRLVLLAAHRHAYFANKDALKRLKMGIRSAIDKDPRVQKVEDDAKKGGAHAAALCRMRRRVSCFVPR